MFTVLTNIRATKVVGGRHSSVEDDFSWKANSGGRQPWVEVKNFSNLYICSFLNLYAQIYLLKFEVTSIDKYTGYFQFNSVILLFLNLPVSHSFA